MAFHAGKPVTAGLSQVAQMDRKERSRLVRELSRQHPAFRSLLRQVALTRATAFASGLVLAVAVVLLVQEVSVVWVSVLVFGGLIGFAYVAVVLTDHRFDLLLAVLGAHRTDELHGVLLAEQLYGAEPADSQQAAGSQQSADTEETAEPDTAEEPVSTSDEQRRAC
ncbi:MAG: hypothetical protein IJH84_27885 [Saccharopolyspora sp.]|uniref:hypothetical protein n=1 Tax=Saccharopolyspora sp. TaxID=33915 RepID=UPI0025E34D37|nr:hypothetical protein [Saccharopolyspora sp.]MBQ6644821.1 hypothetical protein [Saccharopolyspora sp.]